MESAKTKKHRIQAHIEASDNKELLRMLHFMHDRQTEAEKFIGLTSERNAVGFNAHDAEFLSSICAGAERYGSVTDNQAMYVRSKLKKYWSQLSELLDDPEPTD